MKNVFVMLLSSVQLLFFFNSCNNNITGTMPTTSKPMNLDAFSSIVIQSSLSVNLIQGDRQEVKVRGYENLIDYADLKVRNGVLHVNLEKGNYQNINLEVDVVVPNIQKLKVNGSGSIRVKAFDNIADLDLEVNGSGSIKFLESMAMNQKTKATITGSGSMNLSGTVDLLNLIVTGSGSFNGFGLASQQCDVTAAGSGSIELMAVQQLKGSIRSSGDIHYKGNPTIEQDNTGSGKLLDANS